MRNNLWRKGKVSDFFVLQRGFDLTNKHSEDGNIPVISSSGISYYHNEAKVKGPGVITGRKGKVGNVIYHEGDFWPHDTSLWVKDFKGNDPKFIYHFLNAMKLERFDESSSVPTLNRNNVHCVLCQFPPIEEQIELSMFFDTWDLANEKTERLIAAKEKRYLCLLSNLITNCKYPHSLIRAFATEVSKRNSGAVNTQVLSVTNRNGFVLPEDQFERQVASSDLSNYKVVTSGQYAYNPSRINVGSIARLDNWAIGVLSPMYVVFKIDKNKVNSDFFLHWLESHEAKQRIRNSAQGSVRETVSFTDFAAIPFPLLPIDQQKQIAAILTTARQEIDLLKKQANAYRRQKRGLMQRLLTGEWRVRVG